MSEKVNQECSSMIANKLADDLDNANGFQYVAQLGLASQAATMLRQQQEKLTKYELRNIYQCDRIAILETQLRKAQKNG